MINAEVKKDEHHLYRFPFIPESSGMADYQPVEDAISGGLSDLCKKGVRSWFDIPSAERSCWNDLWIKSNNEYFKELTDRKIEILCNLYLSGMKAHGPGLICASRFSPFDPFWLNYEADLKKLNFLEAFIPALDDFAIKAAQCKAIPILWIDWKPSTVAVSSTGDEYSEFFIADYEDLPFMWNLTHLSNCAC